MLLISITAIYFAVISIFTIPTVVKDRLVELGLLVRLSLAKMGK
jgi:hypothetical protein